MKLTLLPLPLTKRFPLTISRGTAAGSDNLLVAVEHDGVTGYGEFSPVSQTTSPETAATAEAQLTGLAVGLEPLAPWEMQRVESLADDAGVGRAALCGLDLALHDWTGKRLGVPAYRLVGADLARVVPTSVTVGINPPEVVRERVAELAARLSPRSLKIKLGSPEGIEYDKAILAAVKETAPEGVALRVDANGGWPDVATADRMIRWLAGRGVEYVEQPLARGREAEMGDLFPRRVLPIFADESCRIASDVPGLADRVDGVNLKLMKAGGIREGLRLIHAARAHGLKVMMGCMSESPLAIAGSAAISSFADYLDLDSHLNIIDAPFGGLLWSEGRVLPPPDAPGLGVARESEVR
ncbi:MAG TPA: dipeptide epimerase [Armatimonadaceae bacterium]|nr:dipeptide epimerase [Armatimonadaceae bacterium]